MRWFAAVLCAVIAVMVGAGMCAAWPRDDRTEAVLRDQRGQITSGTKFGVTVGDPWAKADAAIRKRFKPDYVLWQVGTPNRHGGGVGYPDKPVLVGAAEVSYRDRSWRNGVITLTLKDGHVRAISWHYAGPFYLDF